MQRQHRHAQARAEARQRLRRQPDFRHQHQRLPARGQAVANRLQVDLGLAAAGDAFEQQGAKALSVAQRLPARLGCALFSVGARAVVATRLRPAGTSTRSIRPRLCRARAADAPVLEVLVERVLADRPGQQALEQPPRLAVAAQPADGAGSRRGQPARPWAAVSGSGWPSRRADRQRGGQHLAQRRVVVAGAEAQGLQQFRHRAGGSRRARPRAGLRASARRPPAGPTATTRPTCSPAAERHPHPAADPAGGRAPGRRRQVVEQPRQGHRQGDAEARFGRRKAWRSLA